MAAVNFTRTLNNEAIVHVRDALLIGLTAFGEIERLSAAQEFQAQQGRPVAENLRVMHPTGASDTVGRFADALRALD